jgi:transposase
MVSHKSSFGGVEQRWIVVESEAAAAREKKTLDKNIAKEEDALNKQLLKLGKQTFLEQTLSIKLLMLKCL